MRRHVSVPQKVCNDRAPPTRPHAHRCTCTAEANRSFMEGYMQKSDPTGKRWKRRFVH